MATPNVTSSTDSKVHNNILAAALRKCILSGPYKPTIVLVQVVEATDDSPAVPKHTTVETPMNMSPENKAHFLAEKEAVHLILTGIGDDIYSTVDACQTAQEMWEAIERLQQGESLNIQDVKTNLFWEFGKFTSHDGELMESYYTRFYKLMNEMIKNNLTVTTMQVNVQFLQQLQPEWSRFVTIVKQQHKLDEVSYRKLFDILKQYQNEVNELCAKKLARNANPLALVAIAQTNEHQYYQTSRYKGKEIAKPITPPSKTAFEEDNDPKQAQRDKDMQKNLALITKYFKKIYKPTNNNLRTSLNSKNKNMDTTPRFKNDNQSGQFRNQRTVNVAAARKNVGSKVVQQYGIQCFYCKEYGHFAKECRKLKRVKDSAYHKEKMLLCKQAEQGVLLQAEQYDWLVDADEEVDEQELEAHCSYMAKIQEVPTADSGTDSEPLEQVQNNDRYNVFANELQHSEQYESVSNTCLVETDDSNVTPDSPDMCKDDIQNDQNNVESDDEQCKAILAETSKSLGKSISIRDSCLVALQTMQAEFEKYKAFNDCTVDYNKIERKLNEALGQLAHKDTEISESLKTKAHELSVVKEKHDELMKQSILTNLHYEGLVKQKQSKSRQAYNVMTNNINHFKEIVDNAWIKHSKDQFCTPTAQDIEIPIQTCLMPLAIKTQNDSFKFVHELKQEMHADLKYVESLEKEIDELESDKAKFLDMYDEILPQLKSNQSRDKVLPINSQVKAKKTQVEVYPRIPSVSNKMKSVTACKDSLNSRTLNANVVCATCNKCLVDSNHFACVTKMLNDMHPKTKKPKVVPISTRKPKSQANKLVATPHKKKVALKSIKQKPQSYFRVLYENTSKAWKWWIERQSPSGYKWVPRPKKQWVPKAKMQWDQNFQLFHRLLTLLQIVQFILFIVDSGCTKHMTCNLKLLCNFVEKFLGTVRFGVDQFAPILSYGDLVQGNVAFRKSTCFVKDLQGNDLLIGNRGSDLYTISHQESTSSTPLCLMAKATPTQAWLWHQRLSYLNFDYINFLSKKDIVIGLPKLKYVKDKLCSSCELSKGKRSSFKSKAVSSSKGRLNLLHMDLCGPMRVASINGKKYILVIVDDYSRYTWTLFLRSNDETPEVLKEFLTMIQRNLQALVITVQTDRGTEFLNKTLNAFFKKRRN
nr:hypothetical protein [Tanacetum cinerariifolium]